MHASSAYAHSITSGAHQKSTLAKDLMTHESHMDAASSHGAAAAAHRVAAKALQTADANKSGAGSLPASGRGVPDGYTEKFSKPSVMGAGPIMKKAHEVSAAKPGIHDSKPDGLMLFARATHKTGK